MPRLFGRPSVGEAGQDWASQPEIQICEGCGSDLAADALYARFRVCSACGRHYSLSAHERIDLLADAGSFKETLSNLCSPDPLGFVDGPNMYAYVVQNPWSKFDPEGLEVSPAQAPALTVRYPIEVQNAAEEKAGGHPKPAALAPPAPSASTQSPKLGIGIEAPNKKAVSKDGLNVAVDTGHTFVYIKDAKGNIVSIHSFGPAKPIGSNKTDFKEGKVGGNPKWPLQGLVNTWEFDITSEQFDAGVKAESDFKKNPPNYTSTCQCTSTSVTAAAAAGVNLPDGIGHVKAQSYGYSAFSGNLANPYHLNQQMEAAYGAPTVVNSSIIKLNP